MLLSGTLASCSKDEKVREIEYSVDCASCVTYYKNEVGAGASSNVVGNFSFTRKHLSGDIAEIIVDRLSDTTNLYVRLKENGTLLAIDSAVYPDDEAKLELVIE